MESQRRELYHLKNSLNISVSILCFVVAYFALFYVQCSSYRKKVLGTVALTVAYVVQLISCFFAPAFLLRRLGCKWAQFISSLCISLYLIIAANVPATWWSVLLGAAMIGLCFGATRDKINTYVSDLALESVQSAPKVSRFFEIFCTMIEIAKICGDVVSSACLTLWEKLPSDMCGAANSNQPLMEMNKSTEKFQDDVSESNQTEVTLGILEEKLKLLTERLETFISKSEVCTYIWKVNNFTTLRQKTTNRSYITSDFFNSHPFGYKLCIQFYPNGFMEQASVLGCFLQIVSGPMDDILNWPMSFKGTLSLINQLENKNHYVKNLSSNSDSVTFGKPTTAKSITWGFRDLIDVEKLKPLYLVNNAIFFKVELKFENV